MRDQFGREIDYMRVSVTDRCNLRCRYCMPAGVELTGHNDVLRYEEFLRVCALAVTLGVTKFRVTGGEPLARRGCVEFVRALKALPGVERVMLTTNGLLLPGALDELVQAGLDGVNISIDALDPGRYAAITGSGTDAVDTLSGVLDACLDRGVRTKVNAVLLEDTRGDWQALAALAQRGIDVRFIELMPIGQGAGMHGVSSDEALAVLRRRWPDLHPVSERRGSGPARYYASAALPGRIGFIDAMSHRFCASCNRVRLTSTGLLKPCLCYETATDLRALLRGGAGDGELREAIRRAIYDKPRAHCFERRQDISEHKSMNQIGG